MRDATRYSARDYEEDDEQELLDEKTDYEAISLTFLSAAAQWNPHNTILVGDENTLNQYHRDLPFTASSEYEHAQHFIREEDVAGKRVMGNIPIHLEAQATHVTSYIANPNPEKQDSVALTYVVREIDKDPTKFNLNDVIVVTQDQELVDFLKDQGIIDDETTVLDHVDDDDKHLVAHMDVIGDLPAEHKALAAMITDVPYDFEKQEYGEPTVYEASGLVVHRMYDGKTLHSTPWEHKEWGPQAIYDQGILC